MNVRSPLTVSRLSGLHRQAGRADRVPVHMRLNVRATSSRYERALRTTLVSHNALSHLLAQNRPLVLCRSASRVFITLYTTRRAIVDFVRDVVIGCPLSSFPKALFFEIVLRALYQMMMFETRKYVAMVI